MRIIVTGAQGFVGLNVVRRLASDGHEVIAIGRRRPDDWVTRFLRGFENRVEHRIADLSHEGSLSAVLTDEPLDAIIHAAVVTATTIEVERDHARYLLDVNISGTVEVLEAARQHSARMVYVSSPSAIGTTEGDQRITEDVALRPDSLYGISKMTSEAIVRRYASLYDMSTVSVRIAQPYGPGERATPSRVRTSPIQEWLLDATEGRPLVTGPLDRSRDWTFADDTARGLALAATTQNLSHDLYHLSYGRQVSIGDVIEILRGEFPALEIQDDPNPPDLNPNIIGPGRPPLDPSRFEADFGWSPDTGIEEGMRRYLDWWRDVRHDTTG